MNGIMNIPDDDAMRSSANALTKKLYLTVMDVFGNYAENDDDDYNNMIQSLRQKQTQKQRAQTPSKTDDKRAIIAQKLIEGYSFHGDVCNECVMPLMLHEGRVVCVVCEEASKADRSAALAESLGDAMMALANTSGSDLSEDEKEELVNKEFAQFNEKRLQATHVFASKILRGYEMHDSLCNTCDMPMMKRHGIIECVFCPKEEKTLDPVNVVKIAEKSSNQAKLSLLQAPKPRTKLSQAEAIAARLREQKSKSDEENTESELEKAEGELLKMMMTLGKQGQAGEVSSALQDFFVQKKADRAAQKRLKAAVKGLLEAEELMVSDDNLRRGLTPRAMPARAEDIILAPVVEDEKGIPPHTAPETPRIKPSISCSIGDSFFPGLRKLFSSASHPIRMDDVRTPAGRETPTTLRLEAKQRIAMLVEEGWEISPDSCPECELPLFCNSNGGIKVMKRCVMCGPINEHSPLQAVPIVAVQAADGGGDRALIAHNMHAIQSNLDALSLAENENTQPNTATPALLNQPQSEMRAKKMKKGLKVEIAPEPTYMADLPDPTTSMFNLRGQYGEKLIDPTPSVQFVQAKINAAKDNKKNDGLEGYQANETTNIYVTGEPTPAMKAFRQKLSEPTPNMKSLRNKMYHSTPAEPSMQYSSSDPATMPTPNMQTLRGRDPIPIMENMPKLNEPTPNMQAVRSKMSNPSQNMSHQMYARQGRYNSLTISAPTHRNKIGQVDPTPSNSLFASKLTGEPSGEYKSAPSLD